MRAWVVLVFVLLAAPTAGQEVPPAFAAILPETVVDVSGWETVTGRFETEAARGSYVFHVNPRLRALYQVMRYRVELLSPSSDLQRRRRGVEHLAFVRTPGGGVPMQCWERAGAEAWRELTSGTDEYRLEMSVLMQVLAVHRAARLSGSPPLP